MKFTNKSPEEEEPEEEELERLKIVCDFFSNEYDAQRTRMKDMDERASKIILFVGILVGLLASFGSLLLKDVLRSSAFYNSYVNAFVSSLIFLVISIGLAMYAYKITKWTSAPNPDRLDEFIGDQVPLNEILKELSSGKYKSINKNNDKIMINAKLITISYMFFLLGLISLMILIISLFCTNPIFHTNSTLNS